MASNNTGLCSIHDQKRIVAEALQKQLVKGDTWWVVDLKWFKRWKSYVGYDIWDTQKAGNVSAHPGPIDNTPIIQNEGNENLKKNLIDDLDYIFVPADTWDQLKSWYGITPGQNGFPRKVIEEGVYTKSLRVEVYSWFLYLAEWSMKDTIRVEKQFSRADTVGFLNDVMKSEFSVSDECEVRLWNRYMTNMYEPLDKLDRTIQDAGLYNGQGVVIEVRDEHGRWPKDSTQGNKSKAVGRSTNLATGGLPTGTVTKPCENVTGSDALPGPSELCGRCEDLNLAPIHLCTTCDMLLCRGCHAEHQKYFSKMQHVVIVYSSSKPTPGGLSRRCPKHDRKVNEFFCNDHDLLICSLCFHQSHIRCQVDYIPELANSSNLKAMYDNAISDIDAALGDIKRKTDSAKSLTGVADTRRNELHKLIDKRIRKLHSVLDKLRNEAFVDVNTSVDERMKVVENTITANNNIKKKLLELKQNVERFGNSSNTIDVFIATKEAMRGMKRLSRDVEKVSQSELKDTVSDITFEFDTAIENVKALGHTARPNAE